MCGIVGILGKGPVAEQLVDALKRLEYRGYDSAGVATVENGQLGRRRAEGKLRNLEELLKRSPLQGSTGIGHTRWATHGKPNEANAHPHATDLVAVVHNGIIENFRELKDELIAQGAVFTSDTDTEVIAHLISQEMKASNDPVRAVYHALRRLKGAFALAMIFAGHNDLMIVARQGSPLAIGFGDGEMFVGSDAIALAPFTDSIAYLEDGDWAVMTRKAIAIRDRSGNAVERAVTRSMATALLVDKGNHRHFMVKEIHEQPEVIGHTLAGYVDLATNKVDIPQLPFDFAKSRGSRSRPAAPPSMPAWSPNTGSSAGHACRSTSISPRSSAIARARSIPAARRCSFRSRARRPIRWPRSATAARKGSTFCRSSMCGSRRSRGSPTPSYRRLPGPRSASPRPRRLPAS